MLIFISLNLLNTRHKALKTFKSILCKLKHTKTMSQSTSIPKKQLRFRDHGFDDYMEIEKKMRKVLKFQSLIPFQYKLPISRLDNLAAGWGLNSLKLVLLSSNSLMFLRSTSTQFNECCIDRKETPEAHVFKVDLSGLKKEEVKVEIEEGRVLQINGERSKKKEEKDDTWHRLERSSGKFLGCLRMQIWKMGS